MTPLSETERLLHLLVARFYRSVDDSLEAMAKEDFWECFSQLLQAQGALVSIIKARLSNGSRKIIPIRRSNEPAK